MPPVVPERSGRVTANIEMERLHTRERTHTRTQHIYIYGTQPILCRLDQKNIQGESVYHCDPHYYLPGRIMTPRPPHTWWNPRGHHPQKTRKKTNIINIPYLLTKKTCEKTKKIFTMLYMYMDYVFTAVELCRSPSYIHTLFVPGIKHFLQYIGRND